MEKRSTAGRVILDPRRLLGFDLASGTDGTTVMPLNPKIGPKEARGFNDRVATPVSAAKVGHKDFVRIDATLPLPVRAKIGFKND